MSTNAADVNDAPVLVDARMNLVRPTDPVQATIVESNLCMKGKSASFVRHVSIDVSGTPLEGNFVAGQSFGIVPPGVDAKGKPNKVRLYSLSSPSWGEDGAGKIISTTPKRLIDERRPQRATDDPDDHGLFVGYCSNYLCDLRPGDAVNVSGPNGRSFLLPKDTEAHDYLFLATGTGVAPFRGMMMELLDRPGGPTSSRIDLVMGVPYTTDLLYHDQISAWTAGHDNVHYHTAISRESGAGTGSESGDRGLYVDGLVDRDMERTFAERLANPRTLIYVCGLSGMQVGLFRLLARHGFTESYLTLRDPALGSVDAATWTNEQIRRSVRPSHRCMIEVY